MGKRSISCRHRMGDAGGPFEPSPGTDWGNPLQVAGRLFWSGSWGNAPDLDSPRRSLGRRQDANIDCTVRANDAKIPGQLLTIYCQLTSCDSDFCFRCGFVSWRNCKLYPFKL